MNCPRCCNKNYRKDGFANGKQRYVCHVCKYHFTVLKRRQKPTSLKRIALMMHLEGFSNRSIKKVIGVSDVSIMHWINTFGGQTEKIRDVKKKILSLDSKNIKKLLEAKDKLVIIKVLDQKNDYYFIN